MRLKARGHSTSPLTALDLLARIQRHQAKNGDRSVEGLSTATSEQLELFNTLNLTTPASQPACSHKMAYPAVMASIA